MVLSILALIVFQSGFASYYALDGNKTASGEIFRSKAMTAAHRTLPFGTLVEVRRCDQSKSVIVKINDRGPFRKDRIIDLSASAFKAIEKPGAGVTCVHLHIRKAVK